MGKIFSAVFAALALIACTANANLLLLGNGNNHPLPVFASGAKLITVGDSITQVANYSDLSYTKISNQGDSYIHWAIRDLPGFQHNIWWSSSATGGAAAPYFYGANFGLSGNTATQIAARTAEMVNIAPEIVVLLAGTNTGATDTLPTTVITQLQSAMDDFHAVGSHVILGTIWPRVVAESPTGSEISPALMQRILSINNWIRSKNGPHTTIWDPWNDLVDTTYAPGDSLYGNPLDGMYRDEVHPAPIGAYTAAKSLRKILRQMIGTNQYTDTWFNPDPDDSGNRITNGELAGTSGFPQFGVTGTAATNWVVRSTDTSPSYTSGVASVEANASTGGQSQKLVITCDGLGASDGYEQYYIAPLSGIIDEPSMTNGNWVRLLMKVRVENNSDGILGSLTTRLLNQTQNENSWGMEWTNTFQTEPWPAEDYEAWIMTEALQYNASDVFQVYLYANIMENFSGTVGIYLDEALLLEVEDPDATFPFSS